MSLSTENSISLTGVVGHKFLLEGCGVRYPLGNSSAVLINDRVLMVIKTAKEVFHNNASQFNSAQDWIDIYDGLSKLYRVFVACYCKKEKRFCVLAWSEFQNMHAERLKSFDLSSEAQFPFRVEITSKKGFRAYALGGGRKSKKVGLIRGTTGLITKEIRKILSC